MYLSHGRSENINYGVVLGWSTAVSSCAAKSAAGSTSRDGWRAGPAAEGGKGIWGKQQEEEYPCSFCLRLCTKTQSYPCSQLTSREGLVSFSLSYILAGFI